jgi:hypothetical protein
MDLGLLKKSLETNDLKEVESLLELIGTDKNKDAIPLLVDFFKRT